VAKKRTKQRTQQRTKQRTKPSPQRDIYQEITDRIIAHLEAGQLPPWRQPIQRAGGDPFPKNLATGKSYRGVNIWMLGLTAWAMGYESQHWLTFNQAKALGGMVRKGEKGSLVTFWKQYEKKDDNTDEKTVLPVLRHYVVFNVEQIDGVAAPDQIVVDPASFSPLVEAEKILAGYAGAPPVEHKGSRAAYLPKADKIVIAQPAKFESPEAYYTTLFHELTHSTGHSSRLCRGIDEVLAPFGSPDYSKEELVAEMGAAFLAAVAGISPPTIEQSAAYLQGWLREFKNDKKLIVQAAGQAQKAADHILGVTFNEMAGDAEQSAAPLPPTYEAPERFRGDLTAAILKRLTSTPGESLTDADLRHELGLTDFDPTDPLANPVNAALETLRDRGVVHVEEPRWGDARFSVVALPETAAELQASHCPAQLSGAEVRRLLRQNGWKIGDFAERWGFTQKHVREVLDRGLDNRNAVRDWIEAALTQPNEGQRPGESPKPNPPPGQLGLW
jgi:antirestriction protein ArdC